MSTTVETVPEIMEETALAPKRGVTPEELLAMPDAAGYELLDGELTKRNVSVLSGMIASELNRVLGNHCRERTLGWALAADLGYRCFPWSPRTVRKADVSFIRAERLTHDVLSQGHCLIAPDLAVEVVSPNDLVYELDEKVEDYLQAGVNLIWVIHPAVRAVQVFRKDRTVSWLWEHEEPLGEDVVPGFRCLVGSLFPFPGPDVTERAEQAVSSRGDEARA
jgi:Uma2 family endonuclease